MDETMGCLSVIAAVLMAVLIVFLVVLAVILRSWLLAAVCGAFLAFTGFMAWLPSGRR